MDFSTKITSFINKQGVKIRGSKAQIQEKYGLSIPLTVPTIYVEHQSEETNRQISTSENQNTLAAKMVALQARNWESFKIANPQMQRFLGDVELKESESTVITIGGGAGSGKTRFAFQFINALAQNYKVGHASLEEHPDRQLCQATRVRFTHYVRPRFAQKVQQQIIFAHIPAHRRRQNARRQRVRI